MGQIKKLLVVVVVLSVLVAGTLGLAVVLDIASSEAAMNTMVKTLSVFAIVAAVAAVLIGVLKFNKNTDLE